jgi:hypothetical protein
MVELCLYMAATKVRFLYLLPILVYSGYCWKVIAPALGAGESVSITDTPTKISLIARLKKRGLLCGVGVNVGAVPTLSNLYQN